MITIIGLSVVVVFTISVIIIKHQKNITLKSELEYAEIMKIQDNEVRDLKLEEFADKFKNKPLAYQAMMLLADDNYKKGDVTKAIDLYSKVVDKNRGKLLYFVAVDGLTAICLDNKMADKAAALYIEAANKSNSPWPYRYRYQAALAYVMAGEKDKADELFTELMENKDTPPSLKLKVEEEMLWQTASN